MRAKTVTTHVDQQFFQLKTSPQIYKNNFGRIERPQFPTNPAVWINSEKN